MEKSLEEYLLWVTNILSQLRSKGLMDSYALIGGLAVGAISVPRATKDVDFLVSTENPEKFFTELKKIFDQEDYLLEFKKPEKNIFPYYAVICYERETKARIADILISTLKWQEEISQDTVSIDFTGQSIPVVNTEGLIISKLKSGGAQDLIDVENILRVVDVAKLSKQKLMGWAKRAKVDTLLKKMLRKQMLSISPQKKKR